MPSNNQEVTEAAALTSLTKRVESLERRTVFPGRPSIQDDIPFTLPGPIIASESPRYYPPNGGSLVRVFASLGTVGTSTTTVRIKKNGVVIDSFNLTSGVDTASAYLGDVNLAGDSDYITVAVTLAGTGARDLDVQLRIKG